MFKVTVISVGNSVGIELPQEVLSQMKATEGDTLYLVEGSDGYTLTSDQKVADSQLIAAEAIIKRYKNTLSELAK